MLSTFAMAVSEIVLVSSRADLAVLPFDWIDKSGVMRLVVFSTSCLNSIHGIPSGFELSIANRAIHASMTNVVMIFQVI